MSTTFCQEDQQLLAVVQHATLDPVFQQELAQYPQEVMADQGLTSSVASVVLRLVPHVSVANPEIGPALNWWAG